MRVCQLLLCIIVMGLSTAVDSEVFKCTAEGGAITFSDRGCAVGDRTERPTISVTTITQAELTDEERAALAEVGHRQRQRHANRQREQSRLFAQQRRDQAEREQQCTRARTGLDALRAVRRRGYALSKARSLADREHALEILRTENCP